MKNKFSLTKEEKELENSIARGEWKEAPKKTTKLIKQAAEHSVTQRKREARVNIRLNQGDVDLIRQKASEEGLGYQTLMSSILHKYATGRLIEKNFFDALISEVASQVQSNLPQRG